MDELIKQDETMNIPCSTADEAEPVYIDRSSRRGRKNRSDDTLLTQGILCLVLAASVFGLKIISPDFRDELLAMYRECMTAEPEPFLQKIISSAEQWFKG